MTTEKLQNEDFGFLTLILGIVLGLIGIPILFWLSGLVGIIISLIGVGLCCYALLFTELKNRLQE
jgi:ammonia channel protein AmtB